MFLDDTVKVLDTIDLDPKYLRHLSLTGRHGYIQQGFSGSSCWAAVLDTGFVGQHPELDPNRLQVLNFSGYGEGYDDNGHGTHVICTIAGKNVGIAPTAKILSCKVLDGSGSGEFANICKALEYLPTWRSPEGQKLTLASMSLSAPNSFFIGQSEMLTRFHNAVKACVDAGIAVICSAGNTGNQEIRYPAFFQEPITVAAVDPEDLSPASFTTLSSEVDLAQCGVDIGSAWYQGGYAVMSGTSMSTPVISGIAMLIADKFNQTFKKQIPEEVLYWTLKLNCKDLGLRGVDTTTGAGFCSLQPVTMDLYTLEGNGYWTRNGVNEQLRAPIAVVPPGVTSLPAREFVENCFGGLVDWNPETLFARFRV